MSFLDTLKRWLNMNNEKYPTTIVAYNLEKIKSDENNQLEFALLDNINKPMSNAKVNIDIVNKTYTKTTDENGIAKLNINLNPGYYNARIFFEGNENFRSSEKNVKVTVSPNLIVQNMTCTEKAGQPLKALVVDAKGTKIDNVPLTFEVLGKIYKRFSKNSGQAELPIRLSKGTYNVKVSSYQTAKNVTVTCTSKPKNKTVLKGTDITKKQNDVAAYTAKLEKSENNKKTALKGKTVEITVNKKTYFKMTNENGEAKLPLNLNSGNYSLKTVFKGDTEYLPSQTTNKINIIKTNKTYNKVVFYPQNNNVNCGPASLEICSQILGNHISQNTFADVCNTGSNGTAPSDLVAGAKKEGFKLTQIPLTFKAVSEAIESKSPVIYHHWTGGLSCLNWVNGYGHYSVIWEWSDNPNRFYVCDPTKGLGVCSSSAIINASYNFYKVEKI